MNTQQQWRGLPRNDASWQSPLADYQPATHDELLAAPGIPRQATSGLFETLSQYSLEELADLQNRVDQTTRYHPLIQPVNPGGTGMSPELILDAIPRLISSTEWQRLEHGLMQRAHAISSFISDLHNQQHILQDAVLHPSLSAWLQERYSSLKGMRYRVEEQAIFHCNELVRNHKGRFQVASSVAGTPQGLALMIEIRRLMKRSTSELFETTEVVAIDHCLDTLRTTIEQLSSNSNAHFCILTPGRLSSVYPEHRYLAQLLGGWLVEASDLQVSPGDGHVFIDTTEGPQTVDVILNFLDTDVKTFRRNPQTANLLDTWQQGKVGMVNPPTFGVLSDPLVLSCVPDFIQYYLNQQAWIPEQDTYQCADDHALAYTLDHLDSVVLKTLDTRGKPRHFNYANASPAQQQHLVKLLNEQPECFIAQSITGVSTLPTICSNGLESMPVSLTTYTLNSTEHSVVTGGFTQEYQQEGVRTNPAKNRTVKDTWIVTC